MTHDSHHGEDLTIIRGTNNVFADMGLPNPGEAYAKAQLAYALRRVITERGLNQREAAVIAGVKQPQISDVTRGRLAGFSMDRLTTILNRFDQDVDITVRPKRGDVARTAVVSELAIPLPVIASGRK